MDAHERALAALQALSARLRAEGHPLAAVPVNAAADLEAHAAEELASLRLERDALLARSNLLARQLADIRASQLVGFDGEDRPVFDDRLLCARPHCRQPLPPPSCDPRGGRPRKLCEACSPRRKRSYPGKPKG